MRKTTTNTLKSTKNIFSIALCAIVSLILSFAMVNTKTTANSDVPVDFIVATTKLRTSTKYDNDTITRQWEKAIDGDGKYVLLCTCIGEHSDECEQCQYILISTGTIMSNGIVKTFQKEGGDIEYNNGENIALIEDYYTYNEDNNRFEAITTAPNNDIFYRYRESTPGELTLDPFGDVLKKNDGTKAEIKEYQNDQNVAKFTINNQSITIQMGDSQINEKTIKGSPTYNFDYNFGYEYKEFKDTTYVAIGSAITNRKTSISAFSYTIDNTADKTAETAQTHNIDDLNPYLLIPTTYGDIVPVNNPEGLKWKTVTYCHSDGTIAELGTTDYIVLLEAEVEPGLPRRAKIWGKLNTNEYHIKQDNGSYQQVTTYTDDGNEQSLPILRTYKINPGLYYNEEGSTNYTSVKNHTINELTNDSITMTNENNLGVIILNDYKTQLFKSQYYYDIYKGIKNPTNPDEIIGYELYNYEIKAQANYKDSGAEAFISTYFANDNLNEFYCYDEASRQMIPLFDKVLVNNSKSIISADKKSSAILDNFQAQKDLYQNEDYDIFKAIDNIYLSFGDIYLEGANSSFNTLLTDLGVTIKLYNTYYNGVEIVSNTPIKQKNSYKTESNSTPIDNYFWFQYLDLKNVRYYTESDRSQMGIVEHSAGRYDIIFTYNTYDISNDIASSAQQSYTYTIYIDETSNKTAYPVINNSNPIKPEVNNQYLEYEYNFQTVEAPELLFDASEYQISYSYNYGQYNVQNTNNFWIQSRTYNKSNGFNSYTINLGNGKTETRTVSQDIKVYQEMGIIDWLQEGYINNVLIKNTLTRRTKITSKATIITPPTDDEVSYSLIVNHIDDTVKYDKIAVLEYTYKSQNENLNLNDTSYIGNSFGTFDKKIIMIVGFSNTDNKYYISYYETTIENSANEDPIKYIYEDDCYKSIVTIPNGFTKNHSYATYNNLSKGSEDKYYTVEKSFASEKYDLIFNFEAIKFDYITNHEFRELGEYKLKIDYATSISTLNSNGTVLGVNYHSSNIKLDSFKVIDSEYYVSNKIARSFESTPGIFASNGISFSMDGYNIDVFGVKAYFNRYDVDNNTTEKAELLLASSDIYSDMTPYIIDQSLLNGPNRTTEAKDFKGSTIKENGISIKPVPNTNQVPIYFDYLCNYVFSSSKVSESYIFRYTSKQYNDDKTCTITNTSKVITNYFDKDSRPEDDGYYEIVIKYYYDDPSETYFQVFAFVIDNTSPDVKFTTLKEVVETEDYKYSYWKTMQDNIYTSTPVRATWRTATYFQYEVIPTLSKSAYSGVTSAFGNTGESSMEYRPTNPTTKEFNVYLSTTRNIYFPLQNNVWLTLDSDVVKQDEKVDPDKDIENLYVTTYGNANLSKVPQFNIILENVTLEGDLLEYYNKNIDKKDFLPSDFYNNKLIDVLYEAMSKGARMQIQFIDYKWQFISYSTQQYKDEFKLTTFNTGNIWGSGNYSLKLTYGSSANSNITSSYTIDTLPIENITSKKVAITATNNQISTEFANGSNNLINEPFTLIYNKKSSGAPIKVSYYAIPLNMINNYSSIYLNLGSKVGINTDISLNTNTSITMKNYNYDHSYRNLGDLVPTSNVLQSTSSSLFVFYLVDDAGNTANYYVLYDTSTPKHHLTLSEEDANSTEYNLYHIITQTATLFWGNYKAIEITQTDASPLDLKYIKEDSSHINYMPTSIDIALRDIFKQNKTSNNNKYLKTLFKTFWNVNDEWVEVNYVTDKEKSDKLSELNADGTVQLDASNSPVERYFLLIPLSTATFKYSTTSGNDYTTKTYNYNMAVDGTSNRTIVSPSAKELAIANNMTDQAGNVSESTINMIKNTVMGTYGFYGQNTYIYTIYDVLENHSGGDFWMNNDLTKAFAWVMANNSSNELTEGANLNIINTSSYSAYATSQLYFSYLNASNNSSIPTADFTYKYYPFDNTDFYNNYAVSNIGTSNNENGKTYNIEFAKLITDENGKQTLSTKQEDKKTYTVTETNDHNYNQDGELISEKLSTYPFQLEYSGPASMNGWTSIESTDISTYKHKDDNERIFTTLINEQDNTQTESIENQSTGLYTSPGLYVFRRVYTDYIKDIHLYNSTGVAIVDENSTDPLKERNDQVIQYYFYYVDRNSIIQLSDNTMNAIGTDIEITLGDYINTATKINDEIVYNEDYKTTINSAEIKNNSINKTTYAGKNITYQNKFQNSKTYTSYTLPIDKYNQSKVAKSFMGNYSLILDEIDNKMEYSYLQYFNITDDSSLSNEEKNTKKQDFFTNFIAKYLFDNLSGFSDNTYYNQMFMLDVQLYNQASAPEGNSIGTPILLENNIRKENISYLNYYYINETNDGMATASLQKTRQDLTYYADTNLTAIILNSKLNNGDYYINIRDRAYIDKTNQNIQANTFTGNSYSHAFQITTKVPGAELKGKEINGSYNTTNSSDEYAKSLFASSQGTGTDGKNTADIDRMTNLKTYTDNPSIYVNSNNQTLILYIDNSQIDSTTASTNPYHIEITKTDSDGKKSTIFKTSISFGLEKDKSDPTKYVKKAYYTYLSCANSEETMRKAFLDNSQFTSGVPTKWAIVIFDAFANDASYRNLLSNAKDNATYEFTIYHFGNESDYVGNSAQSNSADFKYTFSITIDHTKPIYNQIKLMEQDNFVDKTGIKFTTYNNITYTNISDYNAYLNKAVNNKSITKLQAQKYLEQIYDAYSKYYENTLIGNEKYLNTLTDNYGDKAKYWNNYYFSINIDNFAFEKTLYNISESTNNGITEYKSDGNGLDSYRYLYFREIPEITKYKHSLTVDDFVSTADTDLHDHNIFVETYASSSNPASEGDYFRISVNSEKAYVPDSTKFENGSFYEVIERDEAGNYSVYLIKIVNDYNEYKFSYSGVNGKGTQNGSITRTNYELTEANGNAILGTQFIFDNTIENLDKDALRIDLTYSFTSINANGTKTLYSNTSNPISIYSLLIDKTIKVNYNAKDNQIKLDSYHLTPIEGFSDNGINRILTRLNEIINYITTTYKETALDFEFNITIHDRQIYNFQDTSINDKATNKDCKLEVLIPGKELELVCEYTQQGIRVTIPADSEARSTKILQFSVSRMYPESKVFSTIAQDSLGTPCNFDITNKTSLGGKSFYFKYYTIQNTYQPYRITVVDNFGRKTTHNITKPDSTNWSINYGNKTQNYFDETYTASDIIITYNSSAYHAVVLEDVSTENNNYAYLVDTALEEIDTINNINADINFNLIQYNETDDKYTRYTSTTALKSEIYSVSRTTSGSQNTIRISQKADYSTKFIILIIENTNNTALQYLYEYGYYRFLYRYEENPSEWEIGETAPIYYNDNEINLYTYIPEIQLTNLSGQIITTSKQNNGFGDLVYIQPLKYRIKTNEELFSPYSTIMKNGVLINYDGKTPLEDGQYVITITNSLGYSGECSKLTFEINSASATSDYSVFTSNSKGKKTALAKSTTLVDKDADGNYIFHYYALEEFAHYKLVGGKYEEDKNQAHIEIITNTNNLLTCVLKDYKDSDPDNGKHAYYQVYDSTNEVTESFYIHFIKQANYDFTSLYITDDRTSYPKVVSGYTEHITSRDSKKLYLMFESYSNLGDEATPSNYMFGNNMTLTYYYNAVGSSSATETKTIDKLTKYINPQTHKTYYVYELSATGIHKIVVNDLAGNVAKFGTQNYMEIYLVNSILYKINDSEPVPNYITNSPVKLSLVDRINGYRLYDLNNEISVTKNGQPYVATSDMTNVYQFNEAGTYVVTVTGTNTMNTNNPQLSHVIEFTIVNPNVAFNSYAISSAKGFTVVSVNRKLENTEDARDNYLPSFNGNNSLIIECSSNESGTGYYTITLSKYLESIKKDVQFSFNVWLNNRTDSTVIFPSIPFGTATTDPIVLKYNLANIYSNVGDAYITINGVIIETINKDSVSETKSFTITEKGEYWIKIISANDQVLASYKLTKNDPLNTTAKIIIIVAVISVIALVVIFIILRRKTRFR